MKKTRITLIATLVILLSATNLFAQENKAKDIIIKVTDEQIECNVTEINTTEVKYYYDDRPTIILALENELVKEIRLKTGEIIKPENHDNAITDIAYEKQRKMAIKAGILTPLQGYTELGFEYSKKPLHSIEGTLGFIGLGTQNEMNNEASGISASLGYKLYAGPDFHLRKVRNAHRMSGLYIKPTVALSYHTESEEVYTYDPGTYSGSLENAKSGITKAALLIQVGKQYTFGDLITMDFNIGGGYGTKQINKIDWPSNTSDSYELIDINYNGYGFNVFTDSNFALSSSFKIGLLIK